MTQEKRRIGDNQNPVEESAIKLVRNIYDALIAQGRYATAAYNGKNKTIRDNNARAAALKVIETLKMLRPWHSVISAKDMGADIHAAPIKTHKLDIVAGAEHQFGQYIVDKE